MARIELSCHCERNEDFLPPSFEAEALEQSDSLNPSFSETFSSRSLRNSVKGRIGQ